MKGDGCGNGSPQSWRRCSYSFKMTLLALELQDLSVRLQNNFFVWCLCANDPNSPQCPWLSSDIWANHLKPPHQLTCQDPTLRRGLTRWQALGRGALWGRAHKGAAERQLSLFPDNLQGSFSDRKNITYHGRKPEKTLKNFFYSCIIPLSEIVIVAISVYEADMRSLTIDPFITYKNNSFMWFNLTFPPIFSLWWTKCIFKYKIKMTLYVQVCAFLKSTF